MTKPDIKRLKYPMWLQVAFLILTTVVPAAVVIISGAQSENAAFRWTFGIIVSLVIVFVFVNHFIIKGYLKKLRDRQVALEHDYEIEVGNPDKIKYLWLINEIKLTIINVISVAIYGALGCIIISAIYEGFITSVNSILITLLVCYVAAYGLKFSVLMTLRKKSQEGENYEGSVEENQD